MRGFTATAPSWLFGGSRAPRRLHHGPHPFPGRQISHRPLVSDSAFAPCQGFGGIGARLDYHQSEALEHENGLTVLGFKFQLVKDSEDASEGMDTLAEIAEKFLVDTGSKFSQGNIKKEVIC